MEYIHFPLEQYGHFEFVYCAPWGMCGCMRTVEEVLILVSLLSELRIGARYTLYPPSTVALVSYCASQESEFRSS